VVRYGTISKSIDEDIRYMVSSRKNGCVGAELKNKDVRKNNNLREEKENIATWN
jgi:hypothetical protein